ncbi:hypothetical protein MsAm2_12990 [Methanolapillus ohkumae]|uniref:Uncharacterized protein n=1 Tax=Methanolapillus ohkumae TaxID=3028298 RepID=A0AA96ZWA0_9EURY|nr:hypothetical protein MsAm2_12990 [Methanosarcinaceae archaeon Am2]
MNTLKIRCHNACGDLPSKTKQKKRKQKKTGHKKPVLQRHKTGFLLMFYNTIGQAGDFNNVAVVRAVNNHLSFLQIRDTFFIFWRKLHG